MRNYLPNNKIPSIEEAQMLWVSQTDGWDCWLASLKMAIDFWGRKYRYNELLSPLLGTKLRISEDFGGFFPYLAYIAADLGFKGLLKSPLKNVEELIKIEGDNSRIELSKIKNSHLEQLINVLQNEKNPRSFLFHSLQLLKKTPFNEETTFYEKLHPSFKDIDTYLSKGWPVIVNVKCNEFYGLKDDISGHLLTFIPINDKNEKYILLDSYKERGFRFFRDWQENLKYSELFNWRTWCDWLLTIYL